MLNWIKAVQIITTFYYRGKRLNFSKGADDQNFFNSGVSKGECQGMLSCGLGLCFQVELYSVGHIKSRTTFRFQNDGGFSLVLRKILK